MWNSYSHPHILVILMWKSITTYSAETSKLYMGTGSNQSSKNCEIACFRKMATFFFIKKPAILRLLQKEKKTFHDGSDLFLRGKKVKFNMWGLISSTIQ